VRCTCWAALSKVPPTVFCSNHHEGRQQPGCERGAAFISRKALFFALVKRGLPPRASDDESADGPAICRSAGQQVVQVFLGVDERFSTTGNLSPRRPNELSVHGQFGKPSHSMGPHAALATFFLAQESSGTSDKKRFEVPLSASFNIKSD